MYDDLFTTHGFTKMDDHAAALQEWTDEAGFSNSHPTGMALPYKVHAIYNRDDVWVLVEQNVGMEHTPVHVGEGVYVEGTVSDTSAIVPYPPVVIVQRGSTRVALNEPDDVLLLGVLADIGA